MGQTRRRSLFKAATWRAIASLTGAAIVVVMTGEIEHGGTFLAADVSLKMVFYCLKPKKMKKKKKRKLKQKKAR